MFKKDKLFLALLVFVTQLSAQDAISGYVNLDGNKSPEQNIHLTKIELKDLPEGINTRLIGISSINEEGFFSFKRELLEDKAAVYQLHIDKVEKALKNTLNTDQLLLLTNKDTVLFKKGRPGFAEYNTTNQADIEWQRLRKFEQRFYANEGKETQTIEEARPYRAFTKDSLQILMVKLISIRELEHKKLLDKDILENPDYYQELLKELRSSAIARKDYVFLEQKLALLVQEETTKNYEYSIWLNLLLTGIILLLLWLMVRARKRMKVATVTPLSQQERNVRMLILEGKTNKEIANELFISVSTVKTHITNIYQKLNVASRKELLGQR